MNPEKWLKILRYHRSLVADGVRCGSYQRAISEVVQPGDVVVDIGTGTGLLALFACQAGARTVHAIEADETVELAKRICQANGWADRVVFHHDHSYHVRLPEPADVAITETLWNFGLGEGLLGTVIDGRERFLGPTGRIIPNAVELVIAPVEASESYETVIEGWGGAVCGVDVSPVRNFAVNSVHSVKLDPENFLADPKLLARVDLTDAVDAEVSGEVSFVATRAGVLHGIGGWFVADLSPKVTLSNAPPLTTPSWKHAFFPVTEPLILREGDHLKVAIRSGANGRFWGWDIERWVEGASNEGDRSEGGRASQSSLRGFPLSLEAARRTAPEATPQLSRRGEAVAFVMASLTGDNPITAIEQELLENYPDVASSKAGASSLVAETVKHTA